MRKQILEASRRRKRKQKNLKIFLFLVLFLVLIAGAVSLFYISKFRVKNVLAESNITINKEDLTAKVLDSIKGKYFHLFPKDNIFLLSENEIKNHLSNSFPRIKNISIFKDLPNTLSIKIEERKPVSLFCKDTTCAFIDEDGFVFEESPFFSGTVMLKFFDQREGEEFSLNKQLIAPDQYKDLLEFSQRASREDLKISEIILKKDGIYELNTSEGWRIILNERNNFNTSLENFNIALGNQIKEKRSNLEYLDLRLENKVFYKFK